jgi:hypothetical protein
LEDSKSYKVDTKQNVVKCHFKRGNITLHTMPLPGSGLLLPMPIIIPVLLVNGETGPNSTRFLPLFSENIRN